MMLQDLSWHTRQISAKKRPRELPRRWGGHWIGEDLAKRAAVTPIETMLVYEAGIRAFQFLNNNGADWTDFDVCAFTGFLFALDDCYDTPRVLEVIRQLDLLFDYLFCCRAITAESRERLVNDAQEVFSSLSTAIQ